MNEGKTRDIIAKTIGLGSGKQWDKLEYVAEASPHLLEKIKPSGCQVVVGKRCAYIIL